MSMTRIRLTQICAAALVGAIVLGAVVWFLAAESRGIAIAASLGALVGSAIGARFVKVGGLIVFASAVVGALVTIAYYGALGKPIFTGVVWGTVFGSFLAIMVKR